jgi:glucose/arabinose dehydrogenase
VTSDGGLLVSDTGNGRVRRIDLRTGLIETWAQVGSPRGLVIAPDGTVYLVDGSTGRVLHLMIDGRRLGSVARVFRDPYDVKAAADGSLYIIDTSVSGWLYRVAPDGSSAIISRH